MPKVFISYSWSSDRLVLELAQRLISHGVDVVLDKWELKEGQDKYAFMERCVNDPDITKVLIICDRVYAQKANNRTDMLCYLNPVDIKNIKDIEDMVLCGVYIRLPGRYFRQYLQIIYIIC